MGWFSVRSRRPDIPLFHFVLSRRAATGLCDTPAVVRLQVRHCIDSCAEALKIFPWENFQCLGAGIDTMPNLQSYHGWSITQSGSSAAGKHKVEQWYIGPPRPDRKPPQLINTLWTQPNTARLQFSEPIQIPQRQQFISNYRAADSISIINSRIIIVKFPKVHCNQYNTIHCQNLLDTANNVAPHLLDS